MRRARPRGDSPERGAHTLRVHRGRIVGRNGDDVFVELGERMQGVVSARLFAEAPRVGEELDFTLRGREEDLWILSPLEEPSLPSWRTLEVGSLVPFRVIRRRHGGLEGKIGPLHAFLPRSHAEKQRDEELEELVGRVLTCEVLEVDPERQRAVVSRRVARRRERESVRQRLASGLRPGQIVQGRVTRVERYGAFLRFGAGLEGLIHVSNLAHEHVEDVHARVAVGDRLEAKVLYVNRGGKRIALGVKQVGESPWLAFERDHRAGDVVEGEVTRVLDFGAFVRVAEGVEGLVPRAEIAAGPGRPAPRATRPGERLSVRVVALDAAEERLALSVFHSDGAAIAAEEAAGRLDLAALARELGAEPPGSRLGRLLRRALDGGEDAGSAAEGDAEVSA